MRHHLRLGDQGRRQPGDVPVSPRSGLVAAATVATVALAMGGYAAHGSAVALAAARPAAAASVTTLPAATRPATDRLVLVSGRDDHGLVELSTVPLTTRPEGGPVVGWVDDATLARPERVSGTQVEVTTLEDTPVTGWVDDFRLRGVLQARAGSRCGGEQVVATRAEGTRVLVHPVGGGHGHWVARSSLAEVVSAATCAGGASETGHHHGHEEAHTH